MKKLSLLAVSAPHWEGFETARKTSAFDSCEPFSLQNAVRYAASLAASGTHYSWASSNWATLEGRRNSVLMFSALDESLSLFIRKLQTLKPNILLLGAMTLSYPGAVQLARIAKEHFGRHILIVLGGKHVNETVYLGNDGQLAKNSSSPIQHIRDGLIKQVFDLVISGDAEEVIAEIGVVAHQLLQENVPVSTICQRAQQLLGANGDWLAAWLENNRPRHLRSAQTPLTPHRYPSTVSLFGSTAKFDVFNSELTVHAYSYLSKGCPLNCDFCSERNAINGPLRNTRSAHELLFRQFADAEILRRKQKLPQISIFVEDSIFLGGSLQQMKMFERLLGSVNFKIEFGIQLTIDLLLRPRILVALNKLAARGLTYVAVGIETWNENLAREIDKNHSKSIPWQLRVYEVMQTLAQLGIQCGVYILWGLGESQHDRCEQMINLREVRNKTGNPVAIGLNWAVKHPLRRDTGETYLNWGTTRTSPYIDFLAELFGESSVAYCLPGGSLPSIEALKELRTLYHRLTEAPQPQIRNPSDLIAPYESPVHAVPGRLRDLPV